MEASKVGEFAEDSIAGPRLRKPPSALRRGEGGGPPAPHRSSAGSLMFAGDSTDCRRFTPSRSSGPPVEEGGFRPPAPGDLATVPFLRVERGRSGAGHGGLP